MDPIKVIDSIVAGLIGLVLVIASSIDFVNMRTPDPSLLSLTTAVVMVYVTGRTVRQVNGAKVDALTVSVDALHKRFDVAGAPAASAPPADGTP